MLGVMIDCSRNAVMTVPAVKEYVDLLAKMGYDTIMLYTEDTYEVNEEPYFGYMRGKYSKEEMKEIDAYCLEKGMELIPCIQTLAHLNAIFQVTNKYDDIRDCDDILLVDSERTFELIEHVFATLAECYTTRKVHIGMDEAGKVGLGKYLKKNGYQERFEVINNYLHKVCAIAKKYGFETMIWNDMFCQLATGSNHYRDGGNLDDVRAKANLPENVSLVHWDYYNLDYEKYDMMFKLCQAFERPVIFAGGSWTWKGFMPANQFSIDSTRVALRACRDNGVDNIFMTLWGDDGAECSRLSILPALLFTAEAARGNEDMDDIKKKFFALTGMQWEDFMLLDKMDEIPGNHDYCPSKYLLYNDPFMGLNDFRVASGDSEYYRELSAKLANVKATPKYQVIFDTAKTLCDFLAVKTELGMKTREMYKAGNNEGLQKLATEDYWEAAKLLEIFYEAFDAQWTAENKPFGFDIQDFRFGGVSWRLKKCSQRLLAYVNGEIPSIMELEEEILEGTFKKHWSEFATPNVVSHIFYH